MKTFKQFISETEKPNGTPVNSSQVIPLGELEKALRNQKQLPRNKTLRLMPPYAQPTGAHYGKY